MAAEADRLQGGAPRCMLTADRPKISEMSEPKSTLEAPHRGWLDDPWNRLRVRIAGTILILVLAAVGVGFIDVRSPRAFHFWTLLVVVTGLVCMILAAISHRGRGGVAGMVARQGLHWLSLLLALWMLGYFYRINYVEAEAVALFAVVLLTLTTWLAGIHFDPILLGVAALLAVVAYLDTIFERYLVFLVLFLLAAVVGVFVWRRGRAFFGH
jgi:hypothetical protein